MSSTPQDELKAILAQADQLRSEPRPVISQAAPRSHSSSESLPIYRALFQWRMHPLWWILILLGPACISILAFLPVEAPVEVTLPLWLVSGMALLRLTSFVLAWLGRYAYFRGWRRRLNLRIGGWEKLVASPHFTNYRYWRTCTIQLHLLSNARLDDHSLQTILFMFCTEANHCGYPTSNAVEVRRGWVLRDNTLSGSVNCRVARQIYELCQHLTILNRVEPVVESILITTGDEEWKVPPFRSRPQV